MNGVTTRPNPVRPEESGASTRIYTTQFWLLCLSSLLFFASFNMIIPELPSYLTALGGAEYKGLIISLFTLTAMVSRPFSGKLADKIGRVPVIFFGALVCFICSLIYPVLSSVSGFMLLRLAHGFSTGQNEVHFIGTFVHNVENIATRIGAVDMDQSVARPGLDQPTPRVLEQLPQRLAIIRSHRPGRLLAACQILPLHPAQTN